MMPIDLILPISMTISLLAWSLIVAWYIHPVIKRWPLEQVLVPFLLIHCFRYVGLMFLIPGVTAEALDPRFTVPAAYGDLMAAALAFFAIGALRLQVGWALASVWLFNIFGLADLLNAVARGLMYNSAGQMGTTFWIPAMLVPPLLVTHGYIFMLLIKHVQQHRRLPVKQA